MKKETYRKKNFTIEIEEYLEKIKEIKDNKIEEIKDKCYNQNLNKYTSYCLDYKCHLCDQCLKSKEHINYRKSNLPEIQPKEDEINTININLFIYYIGLIIFKAKKVLFLNHLPSMSYWQPLII